MTNDCDIVNTVRGSPYIKAEMNDAFGSLDEIDDLSLPLLKRIFDPGADGTVVRWTELAA